MENEKEKVTVEDTTTTDTSAKSVEDGSTDTTTPSDLQTTNEALKELLAENKATMDALKNELAEVKKANAKLVAKLDISTPEKSIDDKIAETFLQRFNYGGLK